MNYAPPTLERPPEAAVAERRSEKPVPPRKRRRRLASPLTRRILAVNVLAPVILVAGLFYLDRYKNGLIEDDLESLRTRAEMEAAAVGEGAVIDNGFEIPLLSPHLARQMVRRLSAPAQMRTRLFLPDGQLMADSRTLLSSLTTVQVEPLPAPDTGWLLGLFRNVYDFVASTRMGNAGVPLYRELARPRATDYPEVMKALAGQAAWAVRRTEDNHLVLSTAVPIQHYKRVMGAALVTEVDDDIARSLFNVRLTIFQAFGFALVITITLSFYLAGTIARPIHRLAAAAERVRRGHGRRHAIPDLSVRQDEIGDLSAALRDMTEVLWRRMDATEAFAADVAHEIKNPLTSLRSAVETAARVTNPEQQRKLMAIIQDDVARLDRLISDISDASRLEAEMSRAETGSVDMGAMIEAMAEAYRYTGEDNGVRFQVEAEPGASLVVNGVEGRLGQILRNLIANALSFSPPQGLITLRARHEGGRVVVEVLDEGPGLPENKLDAIFDRFYSERPKDEKFGTHSGLGLSISKQIAEAHGGTIRAANRVAGDGRVLGARFTLSLPAAEPMPAPTRERW